MKSFRLLTLCFFTIILTSCTSDDTDASEINIQEDSLVGVWSLTEESQEGTISGVFEGIPITGNITSTGKDFNTQLTLTQDPNNFNASGDFTDQITVSAASITLFEDELLVPINDLISQGTWSVEQGALILAQNGDSISVRIVELTDTTLKMEFDLENYDVTFDDNTGVVNSTIKMTFTK